MATATFNGSALVTWAARDLPGCPRVRVRAEMLPGVDGDYVQLHGTSGREITVRGVLESLGESPAEAHQALKLALRNKHKHADGATVATYTGTDLAEYPNCVMLSYETRGDVQLAHDESGYRATVLVEAKILHLTP